MSNLNGIFFITFAMAAFALEDAIIKMMTGTYSQWQVIAMLGIGASFAFVAIATIRGIALFKRSYLSYALAIRSLMEGASAVTFFTALSKLDLSLTAAIFQATPLATTFAAAIFLKEDVGWRRWSAIGFGFIGVMIIIRPGFAGFEPAAFWPLITVSTIVVRDLLTRRIPKETPTTVVGFYSFVVLSVIGVIGVTFTGFAPIEGNTRFLLPIAVLLGTLGYMAIVQGFRTGDVSLIMPFRYSRLIFSIALGMLIFSERPDNLTLFGSAIIVAS